MDTTGVRVTDAPASHRYEARTAEGSLLGFAAYQLADQLLVMTHTEVDPAHEGHGVGTALVAGALDDARRREVPVVPLCPFVRAFLERHPDYQDVLYRPPGSSATD